MAIAYVRRPLCYEQLGVRINLAEAKLLSA